MDYGALFNQGTYNAANNIKVFAGTTDDAFWIDLGGAFDTLEHASRLRRFSAPAQDAANVNLVVRHGVGLRGELDCHRGADLAC